MQRFFFLAATFCASLAAATVSAATIQVMAVGPLGEVGFANTLDESAGQFVQNADGTQSWEGSIVDPSGWEFSWDLLLDPDPFISGVVAVTNNTDSTATFMFETSLPVSDSFPAGSPMSGSSVISVVDANNSGSATVSAPSGGAIYEGRINGTVQAALFEDPYTLTAPGADVATFSGTTSTPLNVGDVMSLKHTLVLTAGDSATANSVFSVVPEPASLALVAIAGLAACAWRFRPRGRSC